MTLHQLADELTEARRYVQSNPYHVTKFLADLNAAKITECELGFLCRLHEIARNLTAGMDRITINPAMLEGYLYGAAAEIREAARKLEPKEER